MLRAEGKSGLQERSPAPNPNSGKSPSLGSQNPNPPLPGTPPREGHKLRHTETQAKLCPGTRSHQLSTFSPTSITPTAEKGPASVTAPSTAERRVCGEHRLPGQETNVLTLSNSSAAGRVFSRPGPHHRPATSAPAAALTSSRGVCAQAPGVRPGQAQSPVPTCVQQSAVPGMGGGGRGVLCLVP